MFLQGVVGILTLRIVEQITCRYDWKSRPLCAPRAAYGRHREATAASPAGDSRAICAVRAARSSVTYSVGVLSMMAQAFGPDGTTRTIEVTVARTDTTELERGYTGQRGQDEQNRRARKTAVQTPGTGVTRRSLNTSSGVIQ